MGATTAKVHRRKLPSTGPSARVAAKARAVIQTARRKISEKTSPASSTTDGAPNAAAPGRSGSPAANYPATRDVARPASDAASLTAQPLPATLTPRTAAAGTPVSAAAPTIARDNAQALVRRVRPATSQPPLAGAGAFQVDPALASRARRGAYPVAAPSLGSFCRYVTDRADLRDLRARGLASLMRERRGLQLALAAVIAVVVISLAVLLAYFYLTPPTANADSPYATVEVGDLKSTPTEKWKAGEIPSLYQSDTAWAATPYGQDTLGGAGAAPTALAMAYVAVTGDTTHTPVDFAQWATDHDLTASGTDTVTAFLTQAAPDFGLNLVAIAADEHALRHAIVSNVPVLVVTQPGTFSPTASVVVLDDIDRDSRVVLHDPMSATRTGKSWEFADITTAAAQVFEVRTA